ncbi:hypothetical protein ES332_A01G177600v1 [Gossypium tomentosum]|uniref:Uncharacterized protein n=1 Tax=Gossypium tomentosum TaxID=34277 RepID=A0A5D2RUQ9_GOSTO|nr:hypothetical protein ES332_A01G177600v1 [Gossypium tomentosum]
MINGGKELNRLARKWQKMTVKGRKSLFTGDIQAKVIAGGVDESPVAETGHFVIYTADQKRHHVPFFSEEEFGLSSLGPIMLPSDSALLEYMIFIVGQELDSHQEKALFRSISPSCYSLCTSFHQGRTCQQ